MRANQRRIPAMIRIAVTAAASGHGGRK